MESKSPKEMQVEEIITDLVTKIMEGQTSGDDLPIRLWYNLRNNQEIAAIQDYANMVSIGRLGLNDHGPVHMKTVCCNALKMLSILHTARIQFMPFPSYCHSTIMKKRSKHNRRYTVSKSPDVFLFQTSLYSSSM